ncbi:MAG: acetate--CoA ligase family protein [Burkholderiales bacterium]
MSLTPWRDPAPIFRARSVGILGASPKSPWLAIFKDQISGGGFQGPLYLINPSYDHIGDSPCYASVRQCPSAPEHLLVLLPAEAVLPALEEAASLGVKSATLYSTGWAEADEAGRLRQEQLADLVARTGMAICGPNCLGAISVREGLIQYPLRVAEWLRPGGVGAIFQSGALLYPFLRAAGERGCGFSYVASAGNEVGCGVADYLKFMVEDASTTVIAMLLEGLKAPANFVAALELAFDAGKPVVIMKVGRSQRAEQSTLTHTGALAGSSAVFDAVCTRYGVLTCDSLDDLIETSRLLAVAKRPRDKRAAFLVFSGSLRSYLLDQAEKNGIALAEPLPSTMESITKLAPLDVRIPNPLDCGSVFTNQSRYIDLARALLADPGVDVLLIEEHPPDPKRNRDPALFKALVETSAKPVIMLPETGFSMTPYAREFLDAAVVPYMQGVDRGLAAVGKLIDHAEMFRMRRSRALATPSAGHASVRHFSPGLHGMASVAEALNAFGVPVVQQGIASSAENAVTLAREFGYPVVMKIESPDISHKSDVGGVVLDLRDDESVRCAWHDIHTNIAKNAPHASAHGVLVASFAAPGLEMNIGVHRDAQFGLAIMVSLGGVWVEALGDTSLRLLPIDERDARDMLAELKGAILLGEFRGGRPRDVAALVNAMVNLSRFAMDHAEQIESIEINPLMLYAQGKGALALDTRLVAKA